MDAAYVATLTNAQSRQLNLELFEQTKELMDRLNQNSSNSSVPPSKDPIWSKGNAEVGSSIEETDEANLDKPPNDANNDDTPDDVNADQTKNNLNATKKPGKQPGAPGHGRTIEIPITGTKHHAPCLCVVCGAKFDDTSPGVAINGHYVLDIETVVESPVFP